MKTSGPAVRLCVEGELDIATVDALRAAVEQLRIHRRRTLLDLDEVAFIDAGSAAMLATTVSTARVQRWDFAVAGISERVRRVMNLTGLDISVDDAA